MVGRKSRQDLAFDIFNYTIGTFAMLVVLYPLYFVLLASFSGPNYVVNGTVWLWPKGLTLNGYRKILEDSRIWIGYRNTILYAGVGTLISLFVTLPAAYALARRELMLRKFFMLFFTFTMFFSGGLIPTFLVVRGLGLYDTFWAIVIPWSLSVWSLIITRTFFMTEIPEELRDSAMMDGCTNFNFFAQIVLPLSKAIVAVIALYSIVGHWNGYFNALVYLRNAQLRPLQLFLRDILLLYGNVEDMSPDDSLNNIVEIIKYGVIVVSIVPLLIVYPFIQRYFVKGVMIGSLKG